jgi:hypothetical protein
MKRNLEEYMVYFGKTSQDMHTATPLKIKVNGYEISVAADDNLGKESQTMSRTDLIIYNENDEPVFQRYPVSVETIVEAIRWAEAN